MFIHNVDGKDVKYSFKKGEFEMYSEVCLTIWGALPYDVGWAIGTEIFKNQLRKSNVEVL
jgi:hypothetical protein